MPTLSEFLTAINSTKQPLLDDPEDFDAEKSYLPFIVNRTLSYFPDTVMAANMMNMSATLDSKLQFDFLRLETTKRKRFSRWDKVVKLDDVMVVQEYFGYSYGKAEQALKILSPEQVLEIKRRIASKKGEPG